MGTQTLLNDSNNRDDMNVHFNVWNQAIIMAVLWENPRTNRISPCAIYGTATGQVQSHTASSPWQIKMSCKGSFHD